MAEEQVKESPPPDTADGKLTLSTPGEEGKKGKGNNKPKKAQWQPIGTSGKLKVMES